MEESFQLSFLQFLEWQGNMLHYAGSLGKPCVGLRQEEQHPELSLGSPQESKTWS